MFANTVTMFQLLQGSIEPSGFVLILLGSGMSLGSYFYALYRKHLGCWCCQSRSKRNNTIVDEKQLLDPASPCARTVVTVLVPLVVVLSVLVELFYFSFDRVVLVSPFQYYAFGGNGGLWWFPVSAGGGCTLDYEETRSSGSVIEMCSRRDDDLYNADRELYSICCLYYPEGMSETSSPTISPTPTPGSYAGYAVYTYATNGCDGTETKAEAFLFNECFQSSIFTYDGVYVTQTDYYSDASCTTEVTSYFSQAGCQGGSILSIVSSYDDLPFGYYVKLVPVVMFVGENVVILCSYFGYCDTAHTTAVPARTNRHM
jgi:hypothetical protein